MVKKTSFLTRRTFLKASAALGGSLLLEFNLGAAFSSGEPQENTARTWLKISKDNTVTIMIPKAEMGQGVQTSLAVLVAEEMDADWSKVETQWAPLAEPYKTVIWPITGGSRSIYESWEPMRRIGAVARELLAAAACQHFNADRSQVQTREGKVTHLPSGESVSYGFLASQALDAPEPTDVKLKTPSQWKLIGKKVSKLDSGEKTRGETVYGWDFTLPGMLVAQVVQNPSLDAVVAEFDDSKTRAVPGVRHVMSLKSPKNPGVAVVADHYYAAQRGRDLLSVTWKEKADLNDSASIQNILDERMEQRSGGEKKGDVETALSQASMTLEAEYHLPYLAHATMEPQCATARVENGRCDVWAPVQNLIRAKKWVQRIVGLPEDAVHIHNLFLGGGFGRRLYPDYVAHAAELAMRIGAPVKVLWTREDDTRHDFYHPATHSRFKAGLNKDGKPTAWFHKVSGMTHPGVALVAGVRELDYQIPHVALEWSGGRAVGLRTGPLRSVGRLHNVFCRECFIDEVAQGAKADPLVFRRDLITSNPKLKETLTQLAQHLNWKDGPPKGEHWGVALNADAQYLNATAYSYISLAVQVQMVQDELKVRRVVAVVNCGLAVDPSNVEDQIQGSVVFALTSALKSRITLKNGRVEQSNFHDYPLLRMGEMPVVDTHIIPSAEHPTGVGEIATPTTMAALCNAIFQATGKRVRTLPVNLAGLKSS